MAVVEIAEVKFNDKPTRTVCVEHADPVNVINTVQICFSKLEQRILSSSKELSLYVELSKKVPVDDIVGFLMDAGMKIIDMQVTRFSKVSNKQACVIFSLRAIDKKNPGKTFEELSSEDGVLAVVELWSFSR